MFLLCGIGLTTPIAYAQRKVIIDDETSSGIVVVTIDKAGDEIIRIMNESQLPYIHDSKAPHFLLMDKQGKFALDIGGYVRATGEYDFGGIVDKTKHSPTAYAGFHCLCTIRLEQQPLAYRRHHPQHDLYQCRKQ